MKAIRAYVRRTHIQDVVDALEHAGISCLSVLDVPGRRAPAPSIKAG